MNLSFLLLLLFLFFLILSVRFRSEPPEHPHAQQM